MKCTTGGIVFGMFRKRLRALSPGFIGRLILICNVALLSGCLNISANADQKAISGKILDATYRDFYERSKSKLAQTLPSLSEDGVTITGCGDLFSYLGEGGSTVALTEQAAWGHYNGCLAVGLLDRLQPFQKARFPSDAIGADIYRHLDLRTMRSSFGPKHDDKHFTLEALANGHIETTRHRIVIENPDWYYELKTLAHGDFNRDHREDLLIFFVDKARGGTYQSSQLLLLTRDEADGPIHSVPLSIVFSDKTPAR